MADTNLKKFYDASLSEESLKKISKREELRENYPIENLNNDENFISFEEELADAYNGLDKFKTYHVSLLNTDNLKEVLTRIEKHIDETKVQLFQEPYNAYCVYKLAPVIPDSIYSIAVLKFKDKIRTIRDEVTGVVVSEDKYKVLYMFRIDIMKLSEQKYCVLTSLPTYTERKGRTFYFSEEINFVYSFFDGFGLELSPFPLKSFFNTIPKNHNLKTQGFHGKSVGDGAGSELPIEVKYKRENIDPNEYREFFKIVDNNVISELGPLLSNILMAEKFVSETKSSDLLKLISKELISFGITESVVEEMKTYSQDGAGWLFYRDEKTNTVNYFSLVYNKIYHLQFRQYVEGWSTFKPLYDEIKKYILKP